MIKDVLHTVMLGVAVTSALVCICSGCSEQKTEKQDVLAAQRKALAPEARVLMRNAKQAYSQGAFRSALALVDSVLRYNPDLADGHFLRGQILVNLKQFEAAGSSFEKVADAVPTYPSIWFQLGNQAYRNGEYEKALRLYRKERTTRETRAGTHSRRGVPYVFLQMGRAYDELGKPDSAMFVYKQALRQDSTFAAAHSDLGELYQDQGKLDTSLIHAKAALRNDSTTALYHYTVGEILVQATRFAEAIPFLKVAVSRLPWHYGSHYNLGKALVRTGKEAEAEKYFDEADTLQALELEIDQARASAINSNNASRWIKWGDLLRRSGRYEEAVEIYRVALDLDPENDAIRSKLEATHRKTRN